VWQNPLSAPGNSPDDPRLGVRLTLAATLLLAAVICAVSGVYILFRRNVWQLQDRRTDGIVRLEVK
jgi:hypothetical protein